MANFEDFLSTAPGEDLFGKTHRYAAARAAGSGSIANGLVVHSLAAAKPVSQLQFPDGSKHPCIMLGSNSYLNLSSNPTVVEGARRALDRYGYGMGAVSLYSGMSDLHRELEERIAAFYHTDAAIVFPGGYSTNVGVISALCGPNDIIINDSSNHASIFDGSVLSRATCKIFPHGNMEYLERELSRLPDDRRGRLLITDGVFSMNGDLAKLDKITELAAKYHAKVMVDDAHGIGVVGPTGRGTAEHFGVMDKIDLNIGMLSKGPGGLGGFCAASRDVIRYLRLYARSYVFSTALPASVVGGLVEVFKLLEADKAGRQQLWDNVNYLRALFTRAGFEIGPGGAAIIPLYVRDEDILAKFHHDLLENGVYTNVVTYPACRRKECRLRICMMKDLSHEQLDAAAAVFEKLGKKYGLIK